jgi:hypothetical protein
MLTYSGGRDHEDHGSRTARANKVGENAISINTYACWHVPIIPPMEEAQKEDGSCKPAWEKMQDPIQKII